MGAPPERVIRIDLRAALPALGLGLLVLIIIFVELCGREKVEPLAEATFVPGPIPTAGPLPTGGVLPSPEAPQPTPTQPSAAEGADRDEVRVRDLAAVRDALELYRQENNEYPSTGDGIQSLCVFQEFDAGCALREVVDEIPSDPLGDPARNGYWLQSTEDSFTIYAQRESELLEACDEHPEHLRDFRSVFCVRRP